MNPKAYERRCQRIGEIGCLACRVRGWYNPPDVHHLNLDEHAGQIILGDEFTIGLCPWHHRGVPMEGWSKNETRQLLGHSLMHEPIEFRRRFGSDQHLLASQNRLIAHRERLLVGGNPHASPTAGELSVLAGPVPTVAVPAGGAADADRVRREEAP